MRVYSEYKDIRSKVTMTIIGDSGREIGLIIPDQEPSVEDWLDLHRMVVNIVLNKVKKKKGTESL